MKLKEIKRIANSISKNYNVPMPIVSRANGNEDGVSGYNGIEIRTELPSYEGGQELQDKIEAVYPEYIVENQGGCIYFVYKP